MPTEQPEGNIRDLKDFKDIQCACCKKDPPQPGGPQGAGGFGGSKMHQKSLQKLSNFQTSLETLFSANRVHKSSKMRVQNHYCFFSRKDKKQRILLSLARGPSFRGLEHSQIAFFSNNFRELSSCCFGTLVFQILKQNAGPNGTPKWLKNEIKNSIKN